MPRNGKKININRQIVIHSSQEEGTGRTTQGHMGKHQDQAGGRRTGGKCRQEHLLWLLQEGMGEAVQAGLELTWSNFSGPWSVGHVSSPEPGSI